MGYKINILFNKNKINSLSVWLLQSLFGGGNPIDLRGRKKA